MDNKVLEIKPVSMGPWISPEVKDQPEPQVSRIVKIDEGFLKNPGRESAAQSGQPQPSYSFDQTKEAANNAQGLLNTLNAGLILVVEEEAGRVVVKVIEKNTKKVVRELDPESVIKLKERLQKVRGVLFNGEA
jgi:flagellar protein FlaG